MKGQNNELTVATIFQPVQIGPPYFAQSCDKGGNK